MNWNDIFDYRNGVLYWKVKPAIQYNIGDVAGFFCEKRGYIIVQYKRVKVMAHRVVWEMFNGRIADDMEIDHIDHSRKNNNISNLRLVTKSDNMKNKSMYSSNKTGVVGVSYCKTKKKFISKIGKRILLTTSNFEEAVKARKSAEIALNYHKNHGSK